MKSGTLIFLFLCTSSSAVADPASEDRVKTAIQNIRENFSHDCNNYKQQMLDAQSSEQRIFAQAGIDFACRCVPTKVDAVGNNKLLLRDLTPDTLVQKLYKELQSCGAAMARTTLSRVCKETDTKEVPSADRSRICQCVETALAKTTDEELVNEAEAARQNFEARVKARAEGKAAPDAHVSLADKILQSCKMQK